MTPNNKDGPNYFSRYLWFAAFVGLVFLGLLTRLWFLQITHGEEYQRKSMKNILKNIDIRPSRGRVVDQKGRGLAENRPSLDLYFNPRIFRRQKMKVEALLPIAKILDFSEDELNALAEKAKTRNIEFLLARDITRVQLASLEGLFSSVPGMEIRASSQRTYPFHAVTAHILGFVSAIGRSDVKRLNAFGYKRGDVVGRNGIEKAFEPILRGSPGLDRMVVDARGLEQTGVDDKRFLVGEFQPVGMIPGRDVHLTIDVELQLIIDKVLKDYPSAGVVAVDPRDGSIRALYSKPAINPNAWSSRLASFEKKRADQDPLKPLLNKTLSGYFPGSVFKIVAALAALEEGEMSVEDHVQCRGSYHFGNRDFRCWKRSGHGSVNVETALQRSCDVYFYNVADKMGIDALSKYGKMLGFGEPTGLVITEGKGRMPDKQWYIDHHPDGFTPGAALNTVLGQGDVLATPLQVAMAYSAIANGGILYSPRLVDKITNGDGNEQFTFEPEVKRVLDLDPKNIEIVRHSLWMATNKPGGTSFRHRTVEFEVAGKTGTAQVHTFGKKRIRNKAKAFQFRDHAWFASWSPADNPRLVLVVFLEHGGSGGGNAAPIAMKIYREYFGGNEGAYVERKIGKEDNDE